MFLNINSNPVWLFCKQGELFFHYNENISKKTIKSMCEFNMPEEKEFFLWCQENRVHIYTLKSMNYHSFMPYERLNIKKTVRNLVKYPSNDPKYLICLTSTEPHNLYEIHLINIMHNKKEICDTFSFESPVLNIKLLELSVNNKMRLFIGATMFQMKGINTFSHKGVIYLFEIDENTKKFILSHQLQSGPNESITEIHSLNGLLFLYVNDRIDVLEIKSSDGIKLEDSRKITPFFSHKVLY